MPTKKPVRSWEQLRDFCEKWQWIDRRTGVTVKGYNPPANALDKKQVPYYVKYITIEGKVEEGEVVTLKVFLRERQRMIRYIHSGEIRRIRDYLIIEVDGARFITH